MERRLKVIIPDYSKGELIKFKRNCYSRIELIKKVIKDPDYCMGNPQNFLPYVYYDRMLKEPIPNTLALKKFNNLYAFATKLIEEQDEFPHAHIRSVQKLLGLPEEIEDYQFLNYDDLTAFKTGVTKVYETFKTSAKLKADRDKLAKELIKIVSETNIYTKKISGTQIQLDKISDILSYAGIEVKIESLGETFEIIG